MDANEGMKFTQVFKDNMVATEPVVKKCTASEKKKGDSTKVSGGVVVVPIVESLRKHRLKHWFHFISDHICPRFGEVQHDQSRC